MRHDKRRFKGHWTSKPPWTHFDHDAPRWTGPSSRRRGLFFARFLVFFGLMFFFVLGGMAAFAFLLSHFFQGGGRMAALVWIGGCGLSLALPLLGGALAFRVFRGVTNPLADVMSAIEAVADGDLDVRVPEPQRGPGEFRRLANSFNRMVEELDRAENQRRNLTADVAHELRSPLHIIQGNLEGVLDGVYEPSSEHLTATLDETHLLRRLVDDLQTLSLAEAGQLPLKIESVEIPELLADVRTSFSGQAEAAGVGLLIEYDESQDLKIMGDVDRLDQVLSNLVANGLRHTTSGGSIMMKAALTPEPEGICISVRDDGEGIPPEDLPYIFNRFWKGDRARQRTDGSGSGLGLAIARQLIHLHGGEINVESEFGRGTTFQIYLPK